MKLPNVLFLFVAMIAAQGLFAQTVHLKLSTTHPAPGQKVTFSYNPAGTVLSKKKNISAIVNYYLPNYVPAAADIVLKPSGNVFKGEITLPATCKLVLFRISADGQTDDNDGKGYVYHVYNAGRPVKGTYASEAYFHLTGRAKLYFKIKPDTGQIIRLYEKEFALYPANEKEFQLDYYFLLLDRPGYKTVLDNKIISLLKSDKEEDLRLAADLLTYSGHPKVGDSVNKATKLRFPKGFLVKSDLWHKFERENNLAKKDSIYAILAGSAPITQEDTAAVAETKLQLALLHLRNRDTIGFNKYEQQYEDKVKAARSLSNLAFEWAVQGKNLDMAEKVAKQAVDIIAEKLNGPPLSFFAISAKERRGFMQSDADKYKDVYAYVLWKANKADKALPYVTQAYEHDKGNSATINEHYAGILAANGQPAKAMEVAVKSIKQGKYSAALTDQLKKDYIQVKGSDKGYDEYLARLKSFSKNEELTALEKTMINVVAPDFALKDIDGKRVSLADLKGKIVVIDFWATWCVPCRDSFPGMQIAVNKYKDDPDVKFLFIDTYETGENYLAEVRKFITQNNYNFQVLMDDKGKDGRQSKVVSAYKASAIPTRFVIDKNGNIRFRINGGTTQVDKALQEIDNLIDLVRDATV